MFAIRNKIILLVLIVLTAKTIAAQKVNAYEADFSKPKKLKGYKLVWQDEFNENGKPDTSKWIYENGFVRNEELQWYQPQNAICTNGILLIEGRKETVVNSEYDSLNSDWRNNRKTAEYTAASLQTKGHAQWQYGRFEIRARIDTATGSWPAIWTLGANREWPSGGEIDIMEFYRIKNEPTILANVAWGTAQENVAKWNTQTKPLTHFTTNNDDWVKRFHVWRMDRTKEAINLYLDDELLNTTPLSETINADGSNPFVEPQFLLLNLALGKNGGNPANSSFPIKFEVDYVRVYQQTK